ncbi:FG-GAP repeat domain-containing protein [Glycomyces harbinensis]|uniref:Repeat domain-containing protein n=1 Tax=Glycomyces harbinensis TaxID=58114 RepID=A0A1G6VDB6_9ACTN|nr:VCBS repeat-containing protein [Glycomyces harbinensis]SDD50835.1 Repeat domain-containing protein [Glycomyces harbinensis]
MNTRSTARTAAAALAGLMAAGAFAAPAAAQDPLPRNDFTGDGVQDLVAVRKSDGALVLYSDLASDDFGTAAVVFSSGWNQMDVVMAGDLTGDGHSDLLARDNKSGTLYTYPGDGNGGFGTRASHGTGWGAVELFTTADFDGDGAVDILTTRKHDNRLYVNFGRGDGSFSIPTAQTGDYSRVDALIGAGDLDLDGEDDFMVRRTPQSAGNQGYRVHFSDIGVSTPLGSDFYLWPEEDRHFSQVTFLGDLDGDEDTELVAVDSRSGELYRMSMSRFGANVDDVATVQDSGWGAMRLPEAETDRTYDFEQNGTSDLFAYTPDGGLYLYPRGYDGAFDPRIFMGSFWDANLVESAGDLTGDGLPDFLVRETDGELHISEGDADTVGTATKDLLIGTGWNAMSAVVSGGDFNTDGKNDLLAREASTGRLWLYPGTGTGELGARVVVGTGWNAMSLITVAGDLDHDGAADVIARRNSDNCLYFYGGKTTGGLKNGVNIGCGWNVMNTIASVGDYNADGHVDWAARRASDGALYLYRGNGAGGFSSYSAIGSGWNGLEIA